MARDSDRDIREEVRIAIFWRDLIGDFEYVKFHPDDMVRWYDALELRGHDEIRQLLTERYGSRPVSAVLGITAGAPHPPLWLVREWLQFYEQKVPTRHLWLTAGGFLLFSFMFFPFMYRCSQLTPLNMYVMNPPSSGRPTSTPQMPQGSNFNPSPNTPPATFQPTQTGPSSGGIAGAAMGGSPAGGVTGPASTGLSAGAVTAPSGSGNQP